MSTGESAHAVAAADDIVEVLVDQHRLIGELFDAVLEVGGDRRARTLAKLLHVLAVHESAEHVVVHPQVRQLIVGCDALVETLMAQELSIRDAIADLDYETAQDEAPVVRLRDLVFEHNRHEEADEFSLVTGEFSVDDKRRLARAVKAFGTLAATGTDAEYPHADLAAGSPNT